MKTLRNIIVILVLLGVAGGFFGPKLWRSQYAAPRRELDERKASLASQIAEGQSRIENMRRVTQGNLVPLYTRSFPMRTGEAHLQYQIWLTQLAEFCGFKQTQVLVGSSVPSGGLMSHSFRMTADCTAEQLYRFLYEFYWTGFLHRIASLDIQTKESSSLLSVAFRFEGITLAKINPSQPYPAPGSLPGTDARFRRLASAPWQAYQPMTRRNVFQYSRPGIDDANWTVLSAIPTTETPDGAKITQTRWRVQSTGKTMVVPVGGELAVGSFAGTVHEVIDDMVILKQSNGYIWILGLGDRLSNAVCIPEIF